MTYISSIRFQVKKDRTKDFLRLFSETGMLTRPREIAGFRGGELAGSDKGDVFLVIARWDTKQDYATWQSSSISALPRDLVTEFLDTLKDPRPGELFEVISSENHN